MPVLAQVAADNTVGTTVIGNSPFTVTGGTQQLTTLFHSFTEFSPGTANVLFQLNGSQSTVETVIGRITGTNASLIDGQLRLTGGNNPDLFLINPNGITFEANATLDLPGSFTASTAESVLLADDQPFSATNPAAAPLLTVSTPVGFQMGRASGDIHIEDTGYGLADISNLSSPGVSGLEVQPGEGLTLVGRNVFSNGGLLLVEAGDINLTALKQGQFSFVPDASGTHVVANTSNELGDISLQAASEVNVSGLGSGHIVLEGNNITLGEGSLISGQSFDNNHQGRGIQVFARENLTIDGRISPLDGEINPLVASGIFTNNLGAGSGGDITVMVSNILVTRGGSILTETQGNGPAGDVNIKSEGVFQITGDSGLDSTGASIVGSTTVAAGNAGNVTIDAHNLLLTASGNLTSTTAGAGNGGQVNVTATDSVTIKGRSPFVRSNISTVSFADGDAGAVVINSPRLTLSDGGGVFASSHAAGNGGNIFLNISEMLNLQGVENAAPILEQTLIGAFAAPLTGSPLQTAFGLPDVVNGDSGDVVVNAPIISLKNGARLTVSILGGGPGQTGDLVVNTEIFTLENQAGIDAFTTSGNGGEIILEINDLLSLQRQSRINAESLGSGNGGNITINAPVILGTGNSDIIASAVVGNGGNITINTQGILGLAFRDELTADNDITASSEFGVDGTVDITNFGSEITASLVELPDNLEDKGNQITQGCGTGANEFVMTGRGGLPQGPIDLSAANNVWADMRDLSNFLGNARSSRLFSNHSSRDEILAEATTWHTNANGQVELITPNINQPNWQNSAICSSAMPVKKADG